ncbi:type II toxin-antitoxin system HicB family antitoxin [Syntrophotalea acetylenica]|uniref:type II toxin-antitoxin system HicB family antitoxin n=1 Tax=Syntrophotalea acetylenica TaxID=29542 RepID=UPI002A35859B|nr:type II toxin-antitoxin system HicB family antitoxin [Syntrophotalea acetylenica]MDY0263535.1 type II toxin-antitoxin system HicB family antitoxin [Syntrophotalea acetylenica]
MMNVMDINGYKASIAYDPEIEMFRGEFINLNGGADFYAKDTEALRAEGELSLKVFLEMCEEKGIEPKKSYSGKFNVRIPPELHAKVVQAATAHDQSINQWIKSVLSESVKQ